MCGSALKDRSLKGSEVRRKVSRMRSGRPVVPTANFLVSGVQDAEHETLLDALRGHSPAVLVEGAAGTRRGGVPCVDRTTASRVS